MDKLHIDFETRSRTDLNRCGTDKYVRCPSTKALMMGYAFNDDPADIWYPHEGKMPKDVKEAIRDPEVIKYAHHASFELQVFNRVLEMPTPLESWRCTMVMAFYCSLPGALEKLGPVLRLPDEYLKDAEGKRLIKLFSVPQRITSKNPHEFRDHTTDPEEFYRFGDYCKQDVIAERAVEKRLLRYDLTAEEWHNWHIDQMINARGYPIDREFADKAHKAFIYVRKEITKRLNNVTGLSNSKSTEQMFGFVKDRGYKRRNMQKDTVKKAIRDDGMPEIIGEVLTDYQRASSTNPSKYASILRAVNDESRILNCIQFMGAQRTHRFAGRIAQFQNVSRPDKEFEDPDHTRRCRELIKTVDPKHLFVLFDDPMKAIVSLIRSVVHAPTGRTFSIADLSAIENVGLGYLARCETTLEEFRSGKDPYLAFGQYLFGVPYDKLMKDFKKGDKTVRTFSKPGKLGAGYQLGGGDLKGGEKTGLWGYAESLGVEMDRDLAHKSIKTYRETYTDIVAFWYDLERAFKQVISGSKNFVEVGHLLIDSKGPFLRVRMPNGSHLHYCRPKILDTRMPWGDIRPAITYEGIDQYTKKWSRVTTHGGKIAENVTQKFARDLLCNGLRISVEEYNHEVFGHVHDEVLVEHDAGQDHVLGELIEAMTRRPTWAPDIPLNAEGYRLEYYTKD